MRFASLGSGSGGNATLVEHDGTCLMVDCGFSAKEIERRLARLQLTPDAIDAILVTHEHGDHVKGVGPFSRRYGTPVWMTAGTAITCRDRNFPQLNRFSSHDTFTVGALQITPFPVPHDAKEPVQFVFSDGNRRLGHLTDLGESTSHVLEQLAGCDALFIEANHDVQMLADGPYPAYLQARVGGRLGHLSNDQSAALLAELASPSLQHLVAAHLSEKNNHPDLALAAFARAMGCERDDIGLATQDEGIDWRQLD